MVREGDEKGRRKGHEREEREMRDAHREKNVLNCCEPGTHTHTTMVLTPTTDTIETHKPTHACTHPHINCIGSVYNSIALGPYYSTLWMYVYELYTYVFICTYIGQSFHNIHFHYAHSPHRVRVVHVNN